MKVKAGKNPRIAKFYNLGILNTLIVFKQLYNKI
jgi:hypothetical protein